MQKTSFVIGATCLLTGLCLTFADDEPKNGSDAPAPKSKVKAEAKPETAQKAEPEEKSPAASVDEDVSPEELAIRKEAEDFVNAYCENDAKRVAAHFLPEAEYVSPTGVHLQGRAAIQASLARFFQDSPGCLVEVEIDSIRFVGATLAIEDGTTTVLDPETEHSERQPYTAIHVKNGEKWMIASVRDQQRISKPAHESQLEKLDWLNGDWVDEDESSLVSFSCAPVDNGKFLLRQFSLKIDGRDALSGSQRIGFDPLTGQLLTWIFDSEGGHAQGVWHQQGDSWRLQSTGVTSDGEPASGTSIYTRVNDHTITWQAVNHVVGGVALEDSPVFTLVRKASLAKQ